MTGEIIDGQWVRRWLDSHGSNVPISELVTDWTDEELMAWFRSLYDRPNSGMSSVRISYIDPEKAK